MEKPVTMDGSAYEALLRFAKEGVKDEAEESLLLSIQRSIDLANDIIRYSLTIRWQPLSVFGEAPLGQKHNALPTPRGETVVLELFRPPTREDVLMALTGQVFHESLVWITADPFSEVGWYDLDHFPWQGGSDAA